MSQLKQKEWYNQWKTFSSDELFLFLDWIYPHTLEDFKDKDVLECGCGCGQHTSYVAPYARSVTAVDLNTVDIALERNKGFKNVEFIEADIASMDLGKKFDIVFSIGVVHHTNNPSKTVENLKKHLKPGGILIIWVYSKEGNLLTEKIVEPIRKVFLKNLSNSRLVSLSEIVTYLLYVPVYTVYMLPLKFLPYYEYFNGFRRLSLRRNILNVFDKLNAPQVQFIDQKTMHEWFDSREFTNIVITRYLDVSWRGSGVKIDK